MSGPGDCRAAQDGDSHERGFAATPPGGGAEEDHGQIKAPGDEREGDARVLDPGGSGFDERPGAARHHSEGDEDESEAHGIGDEIVERAEWGQAAEELDGFLLLERTLLDEIENRG